MTNEEIKTAFIEQCPVVLDHPSPSALTSITYPRISAVIYRMKPDGSGLWLQVELADKNRNSVTVVSADRIRRDKL